MVAVMGDVFALEYNFHVPLYFNGQAVRTRGWLYVSCIDGYKNTHHLITHVTGCKLPRLTSNRVQFPLCAFD
jgi:hypothetical protein